MSSGTNTERITQNNTKISTNNTAIDSFKIAIQNLPTRANLQIINETIKDNGLAEILPVEGYDGFSKVELDIQVLDPLNWSEIGYIVAPSIITNGYNYAKNIYDNWDPTITTMYSKYSGNKSLRFFPVVDTSNVTNMQTAFKGTSLLDFPAIDTSNVTTMKAMFSGAKKLERVSVLDTGNVNTMEDMFDGCTALADVPIFDTSNLRTMQYMFVSCPALTNISLNNILQMCINATSYTGTKTLSDIGLSRNQQTTCQTLSNWSAFVAAGWTI
jgi:hypothetical protein